VTLHFDFRERDFSSPRMARIVTAAAEAGRFFRAGYRINTVISVVYGRGVADCLRGGGWPVVELSDGSSSRPATSTADDRQGYLVVQHREAVPSSPLHGHAPFFHAPSPTLGFSRAEQRVLERALLDQSDAAIADDLGISVDAVKQTWRRVFDRVSRVMPYIIPPGNAASDTRGCEKRRHLLQYLRGHLEELRPHVLNSPKRGLSRLPAHC
jgi:DNA-binding CsgD family transcriptional regulator